MSINPVAKARGSLGTLGIRRAEPRTTEIRNIVMENRKLFLERWHEYFGGKQ